MSQDACVVADSLTIKKNYGGRSSFSDVQRIPTVLDYNIAKTYFKHSLCSFELTSYIGLFLYISEQKPYRQF